MRLPDQIHPRKTETHLRAMETIEALEADVYASGVRLTLESDFAAYREACQTSEKKTLLPMFDPDIGDIGAHNGFWIKGVDIHGNLVHTQAACLYDLSRSTLAIHHRTLKAFYADPAASAEKGEACESRAPAAHGITGKVCYHGEFWIKGGSEGFRGKGLVRPLARIGLAVIYLRWVPDYAFAMVHPAICEKGIANEYGYRNMQPHGLVWNVPSSGTADEWLIWNNSTEIAETVTRSRTG